MAVIAARTYFAGSEFCLLLDSESDSVEVVHPAGFDWPEGETLPEFMASYYVEAPVGEPLQAIMVRRLEGSELAVGLRVEDATARLRTRRPRATSSLIQLAQALLVAGAQNLGKDPTQQFFDDPEQVGQQPPTSKFPLGVEFEERVFG